MIEFRDVTVCYEPHVRYPVNALGGIDLKIEKGEWVFLIGPSGAGKSTLLKLIYCGAHSSRGQVLIDGQDITRLAQREIPLLRRKVGVVFQDFQLLAQKTAWGNVAFALQVIGTPQQRLVREVPRALDTVGLAHRAGAYPHELSGGEQQRLAIARAIVNDPAILLADEPTGNLDPQTGWEIAQILRRINEERGTTVLMATHDRTVVDAMKRRVVRLTEGCVVSDANPGTYHPEVEEPILYDPHTAAEPVVVAADESQPTFAELDSLKLACEDEDLPISNTVSTPIPALAFADSAPLASSPGTLSPLAPVSAPVPGKTPNNTSGDAPRRQSALDSYLERTRRNEAPIGSTENPVVLFDRMPE